MRARGFRFHTLKSYKTVPSTLIEGTDVNIEHRPYTGIDEREQIRYETGREVVP